MSKFTKNFVRISDVDSEFMLQLCSKDLLGRYVFVDHACEPVLTCLSAFG